MIRPSTATQIALHLQGTLRDVAFYTPPNLTNEILVFCEVVEKAKSSDWDFVDKQKIDAEIYLYLVQPTPGGVFRIHARQLTPAKKGSLYRVLEVLDRNLDGFGFVCACEEIS